MAKGDMNAQQTTSMVPGGPSGNMGQPQDQSMSPSPVAPTSKFQDMMQSLGRMAPAVQSIRAMPNSMPPPIMGGGGGIAPNLNFFQQLMQRLGTMKPQVQPQAVMSDTRNF